MPRMETPINPFDSAGFVQAWDTHIARNFKIQVRCEADLLVYRAQVLKFLPYAEMRFAGWNIAWYQNLTQQRLNAFETTKDHFPWDIFRLGWADLDQTQAVFEPLAPWRPLIVPTLVQHIADLGDGWEAYWKKLSRKTRKSFEKRFETVKALNPRRVEYHTLAERDWFFETLVTHHRRYWQEKTGYSYFERENEQTFTRAWAEELSEAGELVLDGFELGGELTNINMSIICHGKSYGLHTVNTGAYAEHFPGLLALYYRMQAAEQAGVSRFILGSGNQQFKKQLATSQSQRYEVLVGNPKSLKAKFLCPYLAKRVAQYNEPEA